MTAEELYAYAAARGYRCVGSVMVGVQGGYPFSAALRTGRVSSLTVRITSDKVPGRLFKQLRREMPHGVALSRMNTGELMMVCSAGDEQLTGLFSQSMASVTGALREQGIGVTDRCAICRKGGCDGVALMGGYVPVHRSCCESRSYSAVSQAQSNSVRGNYVRGFIGALLGGLVGALPSVLTIWFLETIYALLYALIPLGAYYGYRLLGGRMDRVATLAAVVSSVVQLFMVEWIVFYMALHTAYDIWPSPLDTVVYYYQFYEVGEWLPGMIMPALFTLLGLFIVFRQITRTNAHSVADAGTALDSLLPYDPARR